MKDCKEVKCCEEGECRVEVSDSILKFTIRLAKFHQSKDLRDGFALVEGFWNLAVLINPELFLEMDDWVNLRSQDE